MHHLQGWLPHQTISWHQMSSETCCLCTNAKLATPILFTYSPTLTMTMSLWWPAIAAHVIHYPPYQLVTYLFALLQTVQCTNLRANLGAIHLLNSQAAHPPLHHRGCWSAHHTSKPLHPQHLMSTSTNCVPNHQRSPANLQLAPSHQPTHFPLLDWMTTEMRCPP